MKKESEMKKIIAILNKAYEGSAQSSSSSSEVFTPRQSSKSLTREQVFQRLLVKYHLRLL